MDVSQFDQITTAALRAIDDSGKVGNQIFAADPIYAFLNAKGGLKKTLDGGREIQVNLRKAGNTTGQSYTTYDALDTTPQNTLAHAIFGWSNYAISITVDEPTILKIGGEAEVIDLIADKTQEAADSLENLMTTHLYASTPGNGGKDILPVPAIISNAGTLGGIDRATAAGDFWKAKTVGSVGTITTKALGAFMNTVRGPSGDPQKSGKVDLIVMPQTIYETFESLYEAKVQVPTSDLTLGKLGFEALKYKGAEVTWSPNCPAGTIYLLSSKYMGLRVMKGRDFKFSGWRVPTNQDARTAFLFWMGQLVANDCAHMGFMTGVTA